MEKATSPEPQAGASDPQVLAEVTALGDQLADRKSIVWFARCYLLTIGGVIVGGVGWRLTMDAHHFRWVAMPAVAVGVLALLAVPFAMARGIQLLRRERADFERYRALRTRAGLF